jgi:hypothetical protein
MNEEQDKDKEQPKEYIPDFYNLERGKAIDIFAGQLALVTSLSHIKTGFVGPSELMALDDAIIQIKTIAAFLRTHYNITQEEYLEHLERMKKDAEKEGKPTANGNGNGDKKDVPGYA